MLLACLVRYWLFILVSTVIFFFFFQAEDGIRDDLVTGVQTCALPILVQARGCLPFWAGCCGPPRDQSPSCAKSLSAFGPITAIFRNFPAFNGKVPSFAKSTSDSRAARWLIARCSGHAIT